MSSANVLPTTPEYKAASAQNIYPQLKSKPDSFRLEEYSDIPCKLAQEFDPYRLMAEKYKKIKAHFHFTAAGAGVF